MRTFGHSSHLEHIRPSNEAHEGKESSVGPAVNCHATQVYKFVLVSYILKTLHLVFDLHLALNAEESLFSQYCVDMG